MIREKSGPGVAAALVFLVLAAAPRPSADLIVTHAKVRTIDRGRPAAEAIAILGDRIVAVGSAVAIEAWRGPGTKVIDAGGRLVLPGFDDAHVHFLSGGRQLDSVDLKSAGSPGEFARRIAERAKRTPEGEWILGGDWDEVSWTPPRLPDRALIDAVSAGTPVFVSRYDGHVALANTAALRLAGITGSTPDPPGGAIARDERGEPTGILKDAALDLVSKVIPPLSREARLRAIRRALALSD